MRFEGVVDETEQNQSKVGTPQLTCGALFAGIGGFCLGFEQAQFLTRWAVELDEFAAKDLC